MLLLRKIHYILLFFVVSAASGDEICNDEGIGVSDGYFSRALNDSCFTFIGLLPDAPRSIEFTGPDFLYSRSLTGAERAIVVGGVKVYFDRGFDSLQQQYQCDRLIQSGVHEPKILVGGITALPELLSEDRRELFISPRQAYPILESGQGKALFIGDVKPHRYSYAFQEGIAREDVIELATEIQAQYKTAAEWRPLLLVGSRQDYYDYLNRVKTPLVGVYFLDGGIEAHKKYLAERKAMLYAKEERKKPTCPMLP